MKVNIGEIELKFEIGEKVWMIEKILIKENNETKSRWLVGDTYKINDWIIDISSKGTKIKLYCLEHRNRTEIYSEFEDKLFRTKEEAQEKCNELNNKELKNEN